MTAKKSQHRSKRRMLLADASYRQVAAVAVLALLALSLGSGLSLAHRPDAAGGGGPAGLAYDGPALAGRQVSATRPDGLANSPMPLFRMQQTSVSGITASSTTSIIAAIALTAVTIGVYLLWRIKERYARELANLLDECSSKVDKTGVCPGISEAEAGRAGPLGKAVSRMLVRTKRLLEQLHRNHWHSLIQMKVLASEKRHLESVLNAMPDAVLVIDTFGRLVMANRTAERVLSMNSAEAAGQSIDTILKDRQVLDAIRRMFTEKASSHARSVDFTWTTPETNSTDAGNRYWRARLTPIAANRESEDADSQDANDIFAPQMPSGDDSIAQVEPAHGYAGPPTGPAAQPADVRRDIRGVLVVLQDVTADTEVERMKSSFVSRLLHELKNPLSSIKASAEILLDGEANEEQQSRLLDVIGKEADRIHQLTENLLNLSRLESGLIRPKKSDLALVEVVYDVAQMLKPQAQQKGIDLELNIQEAFFPVRGDRDMLHQAILNLVSNAVKYTPNGGRVTVSSYPKDGQMVVEVSDTGPGIPESDIARIFEKFYRVRGNSHVAKGNGLGLALVKQVIETIHEGKIAVTSQVGSGSTFRIQLPMESAKYEPAGVGTGEQAR
ncbi:MAG: ATP-binding protein [Planctomycetia bacterium]|nr:ATP-binding protein [Planctomycetia bacterium]